MSSVGNKRFNRANLKNNEYRLNAFLAILMVISIVGLILSVVSFRKAVKEIHMEHLSGTTQRSAQYRLVHANTLLNGLVADLEAAVNVVGDYDDLEDPQILKILEYSSKTSQFGFMGVADSLGNGYDNQGNRVDISDRNYFQSAMNGHVGFSEVMKSKVFPDEMVQIIAHPIRTKENAVKGVVYGVLHLSDIEKLGIRAEGELQDSIYVIDSCGEYIAQFRENQLLVNDENFWEDMKNSSLTEEELSQLRSDFEERKGGGIFYSYGDSNRYACYMPIGPNKWQLVYSVSTSSVENLIHSLYDLDNREAVSAGICYIILMSCIVWYFKKSDREVRQLHQDATKNLGYMCIALEHSKHIVFEYLQDLSIIRLKTDTKNCLFNYSEILSVPDSFFTRNIIAPESTEDFKNLFESIKTEKSCKADIRVLNEGKEIWYRISMNNLYNDKNERIDTVGIVEDISIEKQREAESKKRFQFQKTLIANALDYGVVDLNTDTIIEWNEKQISIPYQEAATQAIHQLVSEEYLSHVEKILSLENLRREYQQGKEFIEVQYQQKNGDKLRWVSVMIYRLYMDDSSKVLYVITDIDNQKRKEILLKKQAERDGLTGLYNAITTRAKINEALSVEYQNDKHQVFVLIDLDNFKQINDTFGHSYGDKVLVDVANILNKRFRSSDILGRIGGDEFVLLLQDVKNLDFAKKLMESLCSLLHRTYQEGDKTVTISGSIGVAVAPQDGTTFQELYKKADEAQYQIKKHSKNGFKQYEPE